MELVRFEAPELRNQRDQLLARVKQAEAEWAKAENGPRVEEKNAAYFVYEAAKAKHERIRFGWRKEEKDQAKFELDAAEADYEQAQKEYTRIAGLFSANNASRTEYETALAAKDRTHSRLNAARARHEMIVVRGSRQEDIDEAAAERDRARENWRLLDNGTRKEDKDLAKAKVDELKAQLGAIDINLAETSVKVPANLGRAVVEVVSVRPGDLVAANQPIIRVLRAEDLWVKVYVPETKYGYVTLDKEVNVTIDTHPDMVFKGVVIQRANIAEFTPRNVQSVDERRHQVFGVKILVHDARAKGVLNAGMAAQVEIPLD
jgi:multidrug resistance efflux pump